MKSLCIALLLPLLAACASAPPNTYLRCGSAAPDTYYFPEGTFTPQVPPPRPGYIFKKSDYNPDPHTRESYSLSMNYLELPSLSCGAPHADETYRLVWLRSFDPMVAIQIDRTGDRYTLDLVTPHETRLSGKPLQHTHLQLTKADWTRIATGLRKLDFRNLPPNKEEAGYFVEDESRDVAIVSGGKDGARWIIEGRSDRYHVADRWSDADDFIAVGRIFVELSGLKISEEDIY